MKSILVVKHQKMKISKYSVLWIYQNTFSLLDQNALFFVQLARLANSDSLEGFLSHATIKKIRKELDKFTDEEKPAKKAIQDQNLQLMKEARNPLKIILEIYLKINHILKMHLPPA